MKTVTVSGFTIRKGERLYGTYVRDALYKATKEEKKKRRKEEKKKRRKEEKKKRRKEEETVTVNRRKEEKVKH